MKVLLSQLFLRFLFSILISLISLLKSLELDEQAVYYLLSSIFQGLAAILGLLIVSYVYLKDELWSYRGKGWYSYSKDNEYFYEYMQQDGIKKAVHQTEAILPYRCLGLVFHLVFSMLISLTLLSVAPIILELPHKLGVFIITLSISSAALALVDFAHFIYWGIFNKSISAAIEKAVNEKKN